MFNQNRSGRKNESVRNIQSFHQIIIENFGDMTIMESYTRNKPYIHTERKWIRRASVRYFDC